VAGAGFSADSARLWVASEEPRLYTLDLAAGNWSTDDWQFAARFLSCHEVDPTAALVAWSPRGQSSGLARTAAASTRWNELRQRLSTPSSSGDQ
jgi:hypothetical protein